MPPEPTNIQNPLPLMDSSALLGMPDTHWNSAQADKITLESIDSTDLLKANVEDFILGRMTAFEWIYQSEREILYQFIYGYVHSHDMTEDLFQEVWERAWKKRHQLRDPGKFRSWFYMIARNAIMDALKSRNRLLSIQVSNSQPWSDEPAPIPDKPDPAPDPRQQAQNRQVRQIFNEEIRNLDPIAQEIIALRFAAGLNLREVADSLDIPLGTVCTRLHRSLKKIRKALFKRRISF